jgi:hypothetical protein
VAEGSQLATDGSARGLLTLSTDEGGNRVLATVQLWPDTLLEIVSSRTPRFNLSSDPHRMDLKLIKGRLSIAIQKADARDIQVELESAYGKTTLGTGAFDIVVADTETQVRVRSGEARVFAQGQEVTAGSGQRVNVSAGSPVSLPVPDTVNLVLNGAFEGALDPLWQQYAEVKPGHSAGQVTLSDEDRRRAVRFIRRAEDGVPNRVGIRQEVNRDVQGYDTLTLRFDVKVLYQSVPGGGEKASEYPVMVDLAYTDIYGKDLHWYQGFYHFDLPAGSPYLPPTGERVPLGVWYTYESPNLFELLRDIRPARINSISLYAVGHDYESSVSDIGLTVR